MHDGRTVTVGGAYTFAEAWILRLLPDGSADPTFGGGDGLQHWDWPMVPGSGTFADTRGVDLGHDGTLWVVGEDNDGTNNAADDAVVARLDSRPITNYGAGANWGAGTSFFGVCVSSVAGTGAAPAAPWAESLGCPQAVGAHWGAVPESTGAPAAKVAQMTTNNATDGVIDLRFGIRVPADQAPGSYFAPITFEALAPNA
jgi:hypothetical protein